MKECPHDTPCQSVTACRAKRFREKRKREEAAENSRKEDKKRANNQRQQEWRRKVQEVEHKLLAKDDALSFFPEHEEMVSLQDDLSAALMTRYEIRRLGRYLQVN